ncbi:hypothetical protein F4804DRAFT_334030 [Jackrogersella minutella]|nr:hypothetical protein F4804DRAFT_334030 [Jackrogersella minutella]
MELTTDSRGLSILNPSPGLIEGPNILQDLVASSGNDGMPAIDYRSSTGNRTSISYSGLHSTAAALAARISRVLCSLAPIDTQERLVIPILISQSPALYVGLLAILKVGAAFCPLSIDAPRDRLKFILKDIGARVVLTDPQLKSKILVDDEAYEILLIDQPLDLPIYSEARSSPHRVAKPEDLAYVMYTSGSTGTPKGVGISHLAATQSLLAHNRHVPSFSRFLQFAAPTFDVSVFEIFFPLFRGSTLVCCSRAEMLTDLPGILRNMRIDACELTPSVAGSLLKKRGNAPELRLLLTIGEMLTEPVIQEFGGDENQESLLWGMYGPTEATIHCTLQPAFSKKSSKNNIGFPLDTVSAFIIDSERLEFRVLPPGHTGELAVGGSQVATGYINRPEQTSAAFVDTRWGRIYRTGDKARMLPDGTIECLGRINSGQIKLNGQRIEIGEVEHALLRTPGCHGAFAVVIANVLVAFAAVEDSQEYVEIRATILSRCKSWLPAFMIPADIKIMKDFPRLPSGKLDKKTLIEQYETTTSHNPNSGEGYEDGLERKLCEIAETILGQYISPSTRLSSLGLDSLVAIEYASMIRDAGIAINPVDILDVTSVRELSRLINARRAAADSPSFAEPSKAGRDDADLRDLLATDSVMQSYLYDIERVEMCSPLQEAMVAETLKDAALYVNQTELHFPSYLTHESIKLWFLDLAKRNEILRTGFTHLDHKLCQVVWKQLEEGQVEVLDRARPFECTEVEHFLRRPFKLDILTKEIAAKHYTVILTLHHSIYDGWTMDLLVEDLSLLARNQLPVDRPQFRQLSQHLAAASGREMMNAKEFWAENLRGCIPPPLPNFKTTATSGSQFGTISKEIQVDPTLVRDFALSVSVGPQVIFQACLTWLWGAICGVDDIIIGSVSSGRTLPLVGIEKMMGPCMNTLPLRTISSRYTTITELLQGIHTFNRDTLGYGGLPLVEIKRAAGVPLAQKLFDVVFAYQETLVSRRRGDNIIREVCHKDAVEAKLLIEILPSGSYFSCQITWHSHAFSELQINTLFRHLDCLVNFFVANGDKPLSDISRCFPVEDLSRYNEKPKHPELLPSLSRLVERSASRFPTHDALCFASAIGASTIESHILTYKELNSRANRIARHLQRSGVVHEGVIALVMEKSTLLYCAILGILKSGCAYLPILPSTPPQRSQLILKQAKTQFCLVDESTPRQIVETAPCSIIDLTYADLSDYSDSDLGIPGSPANLAYVIYTSGTTGTPKGVSVTNANMLSNIEVLSHIYPKEPFDRMLQACSHAFDMSVFEIFFSWGNGMCLCSATNDVLFEDFERAVQVLRITHLCMTVTLASLLEPGHVPNVKLLVTAGEPMTDRVLEKWASKLWQGYGPSETTNICTVRKVLQGDSSQYLGWSFENTSAFVFFPGTIELMPLGCVGELCFGGDQVTAGYLEMPELTASRFFEHREYGRLYRSGDIGRMLPDGSLIILGRIDAQVKLRGFRIELQDIQTTALKSGFARACVCVLITVGSTSSQQLGLFYVPISSESTSFSILSITDSVRRTIIMVQQELRAALPDYMVPSFTFPISALPLTSSGKVDYGLLCRSVDDLSDISLSLCSSVQDLDDDSAEWTETEVLISEAISETLHIDRKMISRWSSFASLGIDSISAMPLARRLGTIFQNRISLPLILSNPSVGRLASVLASKTSSATAHLEGKSGILPKWLVDAVLVRFANRGERQVEIVLPCTPLQEAMLSSSPPSNYVSSYCNQMLFQLRIPAQIMKKHWNTMVERHGTLRTCFVTTESPQHPIAQVVLKSHVPTWNTFEADKSSLQDYVLKHRNSLPAALDSGQPPVSLAFIVLGDSMQYLSFVCHHAIYDGVSMRHLLAEVEAALRHEQLPASPSFESFLRETLPLPLGTDDFWAKHFASFSPFHFDQLTIGNSPSSSMIFGRASNSSLSSITYRLQDLGVSLLSLCQSAWTITLSLLQGDDDVCFGNVVSGRAVALDQIDTLVAPCFNTIPVRMNLSSVNFHLDLMKKFQRFNVDVIPYQFTGLRHIQSRLPLSHLFESILILQPRSKSLDHTLWSLVEEYGAMDVPLVCEVTPSPEQDNLALQLHPDPSRFPHQTSLLILNIFRNVFDACLEHPSSHILNMSTLPTQWQNQIGQISVSRESHHADISTATAEKCDASEDWTEVETTIRVVLSKLVNIPEDKIRRHTSIYRYGLDSIGAVQFANLLRRESYAISAVDVIQNPTCAGIASRLATRDGDEGHFVYDFDGFQDTILKNSIPSLPTAYEALLPCTPTQQGMISQFLNCNGACYFNFISLVFKAGIDPQQIVGAWAHLATRHQILRTGFLPVNHQDSSYAMVIHPREDFSAPVSVCQSGSFDDLEWRTEAASKALKALSTPPWQVVIVDCVHDRSTMHLAMHHALYDEKSLRMLLNDLARVISGAINVEPSPIHPALSACLDPVYSQPASEAFWKEKAENLVVNKFPTLTPLLVTDRIASIASKTCDTPPRSLRHNAAEAGITIRAALQAAWTRVLSAYLGETYVAFGTVLDGRATEEEQDVIFPMVTTLPIIARNYNSNAELLDFMMRYNADLRQHERTPLSKVQRWLGRPDSKLFDTIMGYQAADSGEDYLPWDVLDEITSVEYVVALEAVETGSNRLQLNLIYDNGILPTEQAHLLLQQFDAVLLDLLTHPQGQADQLFRHATDLFSILPAVYEQLPSPAELLHQLVEQTAQRVPNAIALEFVEEIGSSIRRRCWTYRELDEMGNRVANMLLRNKMPPGSIIATCFNKCPAAYFSILGILKAGCAFLSLDPSAPVSRLEFILGDSAAACLFIGTELNKYLQPNTTTSVYVVHEHDLLSFPALYQMSSRISSSDTCYCLYTSGTTGIPKGCLISHNNAVQAMLAFKHLFAGHWDAQSRWLQFASFHFDVSVLEQYWSWFVGITVVAAPKDLILSDITATICSLDITHIDLTPSLARLIHPNEVPSLCRGVFITGGEQLRQEILQTWGPKEVIYNAYGPTEATIGVTMFQRVPANGRSSNIGVQFPNVGSYVLEPGTEDPVLRGGVGELCVSGKLVGKGYLNRSDLTNERFPVLERYGDRVYRTGDLVRVLHDGSFDFLGRVDDQVKLRGQRLEVGEINHAIRTGLPDQLADVATFVTRQQEQDRDFLVSFLAPIADPSVPSDLHVYSDRRFLDMSQTALEACRGHLPGYMVPTYVLCVTFIPLSANNKADIKRLKQLFAELPHNHLRNLMAGSAGPPKALGEKEHLMAVAVSAVTQVTDTDISSSSSLFDLGIDSINVARLATILQSRGFTGASPSLILRHAQIDRLSQALRRKEQDSLSRQIPQVNQSIRACYHRHIGMTCRVLEIGQADVEYIAPCTPLQEGMITRSRTAETLSVYFNQFQIDLEPHTSIESLKGCWNSVVAECAILRTAFLTTPDGYVQVAIKHKAIPWVETDLEGKEMKDFILQRRDRWIVSNQYSIQNPVEIDFLKHDGKQTLLLRLFHAVYDGHSFELLLRKINAKYHLEEPLICSPSFIEVLPRGPLLKHDQYRTFWEGMFKTHTFQPMTALSNELGVSDVSVTRDFHVNGLEPRRIALRVTHQTVLQAAWLVTLKERLGFAPTIGIVFSGRSLALDGIDDVIGPLFNTLPFRVDLPRHSTWASLVQGVQEYNISVMECVHTPLRSIQKWCSKGQPLFDTLLTFNREDVFSEETRPFWSSVHSVGSFDYPLAVEMIMLRDHSLVVNAAAKRNFATEAAVGLLLEEFGQTLAALANSDNDTPLPNSPVGSGSTTMSNDSYKTNASPSRTGMRVEPEFFRSSKARAVRHEVASIIGLLDEAILENTSLFELGLDSIDAIKLSSRLKRLGLQVTVSELMRNPTIKTIVLSYSNANTNGDTDQFELSSLTNSATFLRNYLIQEGQDLQAVTTILPPTPLQDSMVADMLSSGFHRYFNHDVLEISPNVDINRLKSAWTTVYANSPILRTSFVLVDHPSSKFAFCQIVREEPLKFKSTVELANFDEVSIVIDRARDKAAVANGASDLFQLALATTPTSRYLILSIAHALYDGWSLELLNRDVEAAYGGHYHARGEYESYLSRLVFNPSVAGESFWADYLNDAHPTVIKSITNSLESHEHVMHRSELVSALDLQGLKALCRRYRITPQVLAQGCWAPVLATMAKSLDIVFGVVLSGRDTDEAQGLLFPAMNTIPLRIVLHGSVEEYYNYLQATMSDIMEFQHFPLRETQKMSKFKDETLFNSLFLLQSAKERGVRSESSIWRSIRTSSAVEYPVCVEMEITENTVLWHIAGDERYMSLHGAHQILEDIERVLHHFSGNDADVLEFDHASDKISICGLESFKSNNNFEDRVGTTSRDTPQLDDNSASLESPILDILSDLSGVDRNAIDPNNSIYHLGLDSISAIKASSMLRKQGLAISVRDLLNASSIREILNKQTIIANQARDPTLDAPLRLETILGAAEMRFLFKNAGVDEAESEAVLPALPMQVHMLSVWQNTCGLLFFPQFRYEISGRINRETIPKAWSTLVAETPALRTHFVATESAEIPFIQIITKSASADSVGDILLNPGQNECIYENIVTPFVSIRVYNSQSGRAYLHLYIHHALYDGISLSNMMSRFSQLCDDLSTPSPGPHYLRWRNFVSDHYCPKVRHQRRKFWSSYLRDINTTHLLARRDSSTDGQKAQRVVLLRRGAIGCVSKLKKTVSSHGTTLQALFFAAYSKALAVLQHSTELSNQNQDVVFGLYLANRTSYSDLEEVPFPTLSIVPLVVRKPLARSVVGLALNIQKDLLEIGRFENASVGLWEIYDWAGIRTESSVNFLPDFEDPITTYTKRGVTMTEMTSEPESVPGSDEWPESLAQPSMDFSSRNEASKAFIHMVDVEVAVHGDAMDIGVFYPPSFSESDAKALTENIITTLEAVCIGGDNRQDISSQKPQC